MYQNFPSSPSSVSVANVTALGTQNTSSMNDGARIWVATKRVNYQLDKTATSGDVAATGGGYWNRLNEPVQQFLQALFWAIDPVNGNDENTGWGASGAAARSSPIKTLAELDKRLSGNPGYTSPVSFEIMGDVPTSDARVVSNIRTANYNGYPVMYGSTPTPVATGTMAGYATKVTATNTIYQMNLTSAASYIGKVVMDSANTYAYVLGAVSANVAALSTPMYERFGHVTDVFPAEPGDFTNGLSFGVYDWYKLPVHPFPEQITTGGIVRLWMGHNIGLSLFDNFLLGSSQVYFLCCRMEGSLINNATAGSWIGGAPFVGGCLFTNNGTGGVTFAGSSANFHCPAVLSVKLNFLYGSAVKLQEEAMMYGAGAVMKFDETSSLSAVDPSTPRLQLGVFNTTTNVFDGGTVRLPATSTQTIYGSGNSASLYNVPKGARWALPKTGTTWTTSGSALTIGGTAKNIADVPFTAADGSSVTDGY